MKAANSNTKAVLPGWRRLGYAASNLSQELLMRLLAIVTTALFGAVAAVAQPAPAPAAAPAAAPTADTSQDIVCRKTKETGSLVRGKKTCLTRSQWSHVDNEHQRASRQLVEDNTSRVSGN
jgi:hypothetical protein